MPKRSSFASAYSRHSARTSQPEQMRLASRVEPPFSGKNASGSVWAHSARSCQSGSSAGSPPNVSRPNISTETSGSRSRSIETGSTTCVGPIDVSASVIRFTRPPPPAPANDTTVSTSVSVRVAQASAAV
jgi:hypothetical protein